MKYTNLKASGFECIQFAKLVDRKMEINDHGLLYRLCFYPEFDQIFFEIYDCVKRDFR